MKSPMMEFLIRAVTPEVIWANVPIVSVDLETQDIILASRPAEEMFGYQMAGELSGVALSVLIPDSLRESHAQKVRDYNQNPAPRPVMPAQGLRRDGTVFPITVQLCPVMIDGRRCVIAIVADLTGHG